MKLQVAIVVSAFLSVVTFCAGSWNEKDASLTVSEYLTIEFREAFGRPESGALNDFAVVKFCATESESDAIVFVTQTWHDDRVSSADMRREIRAASEAAYSHFRAKCSSPSIAKRWPNCDLTKALVIRHVRSSDLSEVIAVTVGENTSFDPGPINEARHRVQRSGGAWK